MSKSLCLLYFLFDMTFVDSFFICFQNQIVFYCQIIRIYLQLKVSKLKGICGKRKGVTCSVADAIRTFLASCSTCCYRAQSVLASYFKQLQLCLRDFSGHRSTFQSWIKPNKGDRKLKNQGVTLKFMTNIN